MDSVHVAFCCDGGYIRPLAVALRSVLETARDPCRIHFWIATQDGQETALQPVVQMARAAGAACTLLSIAMFEPLLLNAPARGHITVAAYYRLFVPEVLPGHVKRIIYLDSDLVVCRSIEDLWTVDLGGNIIAAVEKPRAGEFKDVGLRSEADYFNSGVLVIDVQRWVAGQIRAKALDFALHHPGCIHGHDQPALNHVFAGRWTRLDLRWNQQFKFFIHMSGYLRIPRSTLWRLRRNPFIIHYTTDGKPWKALNQHPLRRRYFELLDRTPFAGWRPVRSPWRDHLLWLVTRPIPHYLRPGVLRNVCRPYYKALKTRLRILHRVPVEG